MSADNDFLGLDSLWDAETRNAEFDERRERERENRASRGILEALSTLATVPLLAEASAVDRAVHVRRVGLNWVDGVFCGGTDRVWLPMGALAFVSTRLDCACAVSPPRIFGRVPVGAVLRDWERSARAVTVLVRSRGFEGRIVGVWRDAVELTVAGTRVVVPLARIEAIVDSAGT